MTSITRKVTASFENLRDELEKRIILKDGAVGTMLADIASRLDVPILEALNVKSPDSVIDLHMKYLDAGAEIITTNTFSGHPLELRKFGLESQAFELNLKAAQLARKAVERSGHRAFIAGSMAPTSYSLCLQKGDVDFDALKDGYKLQAMALLEGGVDYLLIETIHDPLNAKAACSAVIELLEKGYKTDVALSLTVNPNGKSLTGQTVSSFVVSSVHMNPLYLGLNCSLGPESLRNALEELHEESPVPVSIVPNAGLPDENCVFRVSPDEFAHQMKLFLEKGWVNVIGGCCGTTPEHIRLLKKLREKYEPRKYRGDVSDKIAGLDSVALTQVPAPLVVGERANTLGSRKFKSCVEEGSREKVVEIIKSQEHTGAHAIDICFATRDHDEVSFWKSYAPSFANLVKSPIFIDSTNLEAIETALKLLPGKPVINSVNLEDGGEHIKRIGKLLKKYPAKVIAGLISPKGMAKTYDDKLATADMVYKALISSGIPPHDIIFDPLVFPVSTGVHPEESIKAVGALKTRYPDSRTALGISNISFGLPPAVRGILNSIYLKMALDAGLDIAILNVNELSRAEQIDDDIRKSAWNILESNDQQGLKELIERLSKDTGIRVATRPASSDPEESIKEKIINGVREGLEDDINELMKRMKPLDIINETLMKAMEKVGEMFGDGKLIISEVLLSAEVFRHAVSKLASSVREDEIHKRGKIILATVKGDVHDIGKNLVGMILESHGFEVIDLGTQVSPEELVKAVGECNPMAVGLSGLLIKSAHMMERTAEIFTDTNLQVPIIVGGAALTNEFVVKRIAPAYPGRIVLYAKDCLDGLKILKDISDGKIKPEPLDLKAPKSSTSTRRTRPKRLEIENPPQPADFERYVMAPLPLEDVINRLHWKSMIKRHMGAGKDKEASIRKKLEEVLQDIIKNNRIVPKAVFAFFRAYSKDDAIVLVDETKKELGHFSFRRSESGICASDWVRSDINDGDNVALMLVTSGSVREAACELRNQGEMFASYALESFALEIAEASASYVHGLIRALWGISGVARGERFSPGYPSMPDLESQRLIFQLLNPDEIGVILTNELMMEPEASVSAVVFHHRDARHYI